jgi:hypothetical protein
VCFSFNSCSLIFTITVLKKYKFSCVYFTATILRLPFNPLEKYFSSDCLCDWHKNMISFIYILAVSARVSSETSFVSKQPKLEPKLVLALSETRRLFQMFCFNIETGSFGVSKQPKQTKDQHRNSTPTGVPKYGSH